MILTHILFMLLRLQTSDSFNHLMTVDIKFSTKVNRVR